MYTIERISTCVTCFVNMNKITFIKKNDYNKKYKIFYFDRFTQKWSEYSWDITT